MSSTTPQLKATSYCVASTGDKALSSLKSPFRDFAAIRFHVALRFMLQLANPAEFPQYMQQ